MVGQQRILQEVTRLKESASPDEAGLYDDLTTLLTSGRSHKMAPVVASVLGRAPGRILDIGCGYGALAIYFALRGIETVGIDLKDEALKAGSRLAAELGLSNVTLTAMDACSISVTDFDLALSTDFFEHLTYQQQPLHLRSVWQALKPGGIYMIRAPHRANIRQHMVEHIGLPSFRTLRQQAMDAGFSVRFGIAHTSLISPVTYHMALEQWFESRNWSGLAIYKGLQKFGLANILAYLES